MGRRRKRSEKWVPGFEGLYVINGRKEVISVGYYQTKTLKVKAGRVRLHKDGRVFLLYPEQIWKEASQVKRQAPRDAARGLTATQKRRFQRIYREGMNTKHLARTLGATERSVKEHIKKTTVD